MKWHETLNAIVEALHPIPGVEGAFLGGSLANENQDDYSDIDLGIATEDSAEALVEVYGRRSQLVGIAGEPVASLDRGWQHCKMVAAVYGKSLYPPIGLEIDLVFSQLRHVAEQMPYSDYAIVFDRRRRLEPELDKLSRVRPAREVEKELKQHLTWCAFYLHDAVKAHKRGDSFQAQALLEEIRRLVFFAAAHRRDEQIHGAKWAYRYLSSEERQLLADSYCRCDEPTIRRVTELYLRCLSDLESKYQVAEGVEELRLAVRQLL
jgi:hypothetical protein